MPFGGIKKAAGGLLGGGGEQKGPQGGAPMLTRNETNKRRVKDLRDPQFIPGGKKDD